MNLFKKYVTPVLLVAIVASCSSIEAMDFNNWLDCARSVASQAYGVLKPKKVWMPIAATATALCLLKGMISYGEKSLSEDIKSMDKNHGEIYGYLGSLNSASGEEMADEKISEIYQNLRNYSSDMGKRDLKLRGYLEKLPSVGFLVRVQDASPQEAEEYLSQYRPSVCQRLALLVSNIDRSVIRKIRKEYEKTENALNQALETIENIKHPFGDPFTEGNKDEFSKCLNDLSEKFLAVGDAPAIKPAKKR